MNWNTQDHSDLYNLDRHLYLTILWVILLLL